ncbi:flavin reductase family protein [Fulvimarina sp. 2208YS6-2-32]|uniref:Flavin reductase family protein n=1 Tax=Fulvimarina uroteuthidis TaxID=3098149 RepID=A0ABU5HYP2_9HYPH|nr:flavin reductase family protein [Fulvimarina sp. 2208YS6-2-32]MDY8108012.1 flavin reductase family protein [Fulvimarina sp. 2208YS6-2-32]
MFYRTDTNDHGLAHDPFKAIVSPRPIGWISTLSADGIANLAPYSFFTAIGDSPKLVMVSSSGLKDMARTAIETGEFVCNLATRALARQVVRTSAQAPSHVDEFEMTGLTKADCRIVKAPRVAESPAALECVVTQSFHPKTQAGHSNNLVIIGEVVGIHLDEAILKDGRIDMALAAPLARLGYLDYSVSDEVFAIPRPRTPDGSDI